LHEGIAWRYCNKVLQEGIAWRYCKKVLILVRDVIWVSALLNKRVAVWHIAHISYQRVLQCCMCCAAAYSCWRWQERIAERWSGQPEIMQGLVSVVRTRRLRCADTFQARRS
jgi:hypothetical protein